jgi:hypothetical protein
MRKLTVRSSSCSMPPTRRFWAPWIWWDDPFLTVFPVEKPLNVPNMYPLVI